MKKRTITTRYNSEEADGLDSIIGESYDNFVRLERRNLLATSSITLISYFGDVKPASFNLSLFELPGLSVNMLFTILLLTCIYFFIAFVIYAYPSFRESKQSWKELTSKTVQITSEYNWYYFDREVLLSDSRYYLWLFFNYIFPVVLGYLAILAAILKAA